MNILIINSGSSSLKYQLMDMDTRTVVATGLIERIGEAMGSITQKSHPEKWPDRKNTEDVAVPDHDAAMRLMAAKLTDPQWGVIRALTEIDALGHRVVQGGESFTSPVMVDKAVMETIRENIPLAPLHKANLTGMEVAAELFPGTPGVAVFDTEFHQTMPKKAFLYPIPMELYTDHRIRRYGFHGTSHKYVTRAAAEFLGKPVDAVDLITVHLGNGCSMAAVKGGRCVDTTMGLTPLAGLMMATRCGDIDPAILPFLAENADMRLAEIDAMLNTRSGLLGICGKSDMRDIHAAREQGDENAQLAFEMFAYRVRKTMGAYLAVLGRADAVVFTAGIGENDADVRAAVCAGLDGLGIAVAPEKNGLRSPGIRAISPEGSPVTVLIVPTNEELEIALATERLVAG
jgi:acetate kinase